MVLLLVLSVLFVAIASLILYARWNRGSLESLNIPVIKPHFLLGSTHDAHLVRHGIRDIEWMKQYGPVFGVYEGREAQVHVNDIEMVRHIMVKNSDYFNARRQLEFGDPVLNEIPAFLKGEKWKMVRQLFSPTVTSGKVKIMSVAMNEAVKDFVGDLKQKIANSKDGGLQNYDLRDGLFTMTIDLILRSVFSIKVGMGSNNESQFVNILKTFLTGHAQPSPLLPWTLSFPFIMKLMTLHISVDTQATHQFVSTFKKLMEDRKRNGDGGKRGDFTDYVMELLEKVDTPEFKKNDVTEFTILCQAAVFFLAGQDQISNLSLIVVFLVSQKPEVEKKIVQELEKVLEKQRQVGGNDGIDHDCLSELTYLTACVNEVLRLYPVFFRPERVCTKDWELDGVRIKQGMTVVIPIWAANRNPKYYENPEQFDPERFMPYNKDKMHPYAFTSFGHGPRNCTGERFAYEALLLTTAHLFRELKCIAKDGTKLEFNAGSLFFHFPGPLNFNIRVRS